MTFSHDETRGGQRNEPESERRDQEAVQLYEGGLSTREVGLRLGLSTQKVYRLLSKSGVARRRPGGHLGSSRRRNPGPSPEMQQRAKEFVRLYVEEGLSLREVGARFGLSGERVRRVLEKAGVIRRSRGGGRVSEQPAERSAEAVRLYVEGGLTLAEIAAHLGVSSLMVARILEKAGVPRRRGSSALTQSQLAERAEQILRLSLEQGLTQEEVGARLRVSGATVCRTLVGAGVKVSGHRAEQRMQRNSEIVRAHLGEGLSLQEMGVRFGLHRSTVAVILEKAGVRMRASCLTGDLRKRRDGEIVRRYVEERLSLRQIAARCRLSFSGVRSILQRAGVQPRSSSHLALTREELAQRNREIVRLHREEGLAARQISGQLALSIERVYTALRAAGISRTRSGHPSAGSSQQRTSREPPRAAGGGRGRPGQ